MGQCFFGRANIVSPHGFSGGSSSKQSPAGTSSQTNSSTPAQSSTSGSGFSGGASNKTNVPSTPSTSNSTVTKDGTTYSTGNQKPSSSVFGASQTPPINGSKTNPDTGRTYYGGGTYYNSLPAGQKQSSSIWPMVGAFAAGTFLGSMLHPSGGYYPTAGGGYVHQPFSFMGLILDLAIAALVIWLVVVIFRSLRGRRA